jgi:hypothetical protein
MVLENKQKMIQTNQLQLPLNLSLSFTTHCWRPPKPKLFWRFCKFLGPTKQPKKHNLYGPKLKFYFQGIRPFRKATTWKFTAENFPHFGAYWCVLRFRGSNSNFTLGQVFFWGVSHTQMLLRVFCPFWGPHRAFLVSGAQNHILLRGNFSFWEVSQTKILLRVFA